MTVPNRLTLPEEWRAIPGLDDRFEASSHGRIRRARATGRGGKAAGSLVKLAIGRSGYPKLSTSINRRRVTYWAHQLIAAAFHGPCPEGLEVAHRDGVGVNIWPENLLYATHSENVAHKEVHGTVLRGERVGNAKLTAADVLAIRASADGPKALAAEFGVSRGHIHRLRAGGRWQHLEGVAA